MLTTREITDSTELLICQKCPYLGKRSPQEVLRELEHVKLENAQLRRVFETAVEAFKEHDEKIKQLKEENNTLRSKLQDEHQKPFVIKKKRQDDDESSPTSSRPRGAPLGHRGGTRRKPDEIDEYIDVFPDSCDCGSKDLSECGKVDEHIIEEIEIKKVKVICYRRHYGYCKRCKKVVSARVSEDIPKGYFGPTAKAVAQYLRYQAKLPFDKVSKIFKDLFGGEITPQALVGFDKKAASQAEPLYKILEEKARWSRSINADETGWKVAGDNAWLWCFVNNQIVLYKIDRSRASAVVEEVLGGNYAGVLGSDCYLSYNPVKAKDKQKCLRHYEGDAKDIEKFYPHDEEAIAFTLKLKDIFKRAREVKKDWKAEKISDEEALGKAEEFEDELDELTENPLKNEEVEKLRARIIRHRKENFTFLRYYDVAPDNNISERALRPSVIMRKITYGNNSDTGAENHQIMMSVIETAKMNGTNPLQMLMKLTSGRGIEELKQLLLGVTGKPEQRTPG